MKLGIVFEGGASRTLFSCGAIDALMEEKIHADYIIGVSAGIAYGVGYASGQIGRNLEVAVKYMHDKRYMGLRHMLNSHNRGYYNLDFVFEEIPKNLVPFDFDAFENYSGKIVAVVTNIETGKAEYLEVPRDDRSFRLIRASCALPILFRPEKIDGKLYMDGGISDSIPFRRALDEGCDKVIVVLTREHDYVKLDESAIKISKHLYRKYPLFAEALVGRTKQYNQSRKELFKLAESGSVFVLEPQHSTKGFKRTEHSPKKLTVMYNDGYDVTKSKMSEIKEYLGI